MSSKYPYLPLFIDAYVSDTRHLTLEEHGAYLNLLMEAWSRPSCSLPDDDKYLSRVLGIGLEDWAELKPAVMKFWKYDGRSRTWMQKRLNKERDYVKKRRRSQQGISASRWNNSKNMYAPTPTPTPTRICTIEREGFSVVEREKKGTVCPEIPWEGNGIDESDKEDGPFSVVDRGRK